MGIRKINESTLTAIADAIRAKTGGSALINPEDMADAIDSIQTGGGDTFAEFLSGQMSSYTSADVTVYDTSSFSRVYLPNVESASGRFPFLYATEICLPKCIGGSLYYASTGSLLPLQKLVIGGHKTDGYAAISRLGELTILDITGGGTTGVSLNFSHYSSYNAKLSTVILRPSYIVRCNSNRYSGTFLSTPFAQNGIGGEVYIPESLYDHLGDGSALDYKAESGWSVYDGYGTITWKQIEGSIYETQYGDGTPIPT